MKLQHHINKHQKAIFAAIGLAGLVLIAACNWRLETRTPPKEVAELAPDFSLPDHEGRTVTLDSLVQDGPAVVVFYRGFW
jgi:cytochrome oxidase Cu insertion factor (SCO1/SenC/PrrC family)